MKKRDIAFGYKALIVLLLVTGLILMVSVAYAQELRSGAVLKGNATYQAEPNIEKIYQAWMLAVRYRFEETVEETHDPDILEEIASLRGDNLGYFLDSIEAINQVQTTMFPPSSMDSEWVESLTLSEERELVEIVTATVFLTGRDSESITELSEREQAYIDSLLTFLTAIARDEGDSVFDAKYLEYRARIIPFIEDTGLELFNPSQEGIDKYLEYFQIDDVQTVDLDPSDAPEAECSITKTVDNWPSKSSSYYGTTGSSWYETMETSQTDCDIWVRYYMGGALHYGQISAGTSSAQCVLDKTSQLAGDWTSSMIYNYVQYGKNTVTWWWPFGCNTTGSALMSATKWRP